MQMNNGRRLLLCVGLLLTGGALLWGALFPPGTAATDGWQPVNARLEASLGASGGQGKRAAGGAQGAQGAEAAEGGGAGGSGEGAAAGDSAAAGDGAGDEAAVAAAAGGADRAAEGEAPPVGSAGVAEGGGDGSSAAGGDAPASAAQEAADGRLDLNTATAEQLDELPGIGPAKAQAIVDDRARNGSFRSVDDLMRVKGIGPKMLDKLRDSVAVTN